MFAVCVVVVVAVITWGTDAISTEPLLLVVLFDGFRWDYLDKFHTPNFDSLVEKGVRARQVINVVPTITMSNHYTILTGTYPETHGIVANNFYDPNLNRSFYMLRDDEQTDPVWFDTGVEPIWVTNQLNSTSRLSGTILWPDSLAPVKNVSPSFVIGPMPWDENIITFKERIHRLLEWFMDRDKPINLGLLYFEQPDETGHRHGPNSEELKKTVQDLDSLLGHLVKRLKQENLFDRMNIIITADHGMAEVLPENHVDIFNFLNGSLYDDYELGSIGLLHPLPGKEDEVFTKLKDLEKAYKQVKVYKKSDDFMKALNYSNNDRISPIIVLVESGFYLVRNKEDIRTSIGGMHGYPVSAEDMHPFFISHGPVFKEGLLTETLHNIDFYELMCHILQITPAPNNGSLLNIKHILRDTGTPTTTLAASPSLVTTKPTTSGLTKPVSPLITKAIDLTATNSTLSGITKSIWTKTTTSTTPVTVNATSPVITNSTSTVTTKLTTHVTTKPDKLRTDTTNLVTTKPATSASSVKMKPTQQATTNSVKANSTNQAATKLSHPTTTQSSSTVTRKSTNHVTAKLTTHVAMNSINSISTKSTAPETAKSTMSTGSVTTQASHPVTRISTSRAITTLTNPVTTKSTNMVTTTITSSVTAKSTIPEITKLAKLATKKSNNPLPIKPTNPSATKSTTPITMESANPANDKSTTTTLPKSTYRVTTKSTTRLTTESAISAITRSTSAPATKSTKYTILKTVDHTAAKSTTPETRKRTKPVATQSTNHVPRNSTELKLVIYIMAAVFCALAAIIIMIAVHKHKTTGKRVTSRSDVTLLDVTSDKDFTKPLLQDGSNDEDDAEYPDP